MNQVHKIQANGKSILVIDFSNCKESKMIELVSKSRSLILAEGVPQLILAIFNEKASVTPNFMKHFRSDQREAVKLIKKQAVIGANNPKKMIIKGYNSQFGRDIRVFGSREAAIKYLLEEEEPIIDQ